MKRLPFFVGTGLLQCTYIGLVFSIGLPEGKSIFDYNGSLPISELSGFGKLSTFFYFNIYMYMIFLRLNDMQREKKQIWFLLIPLYNVYFFLLLHFGKSR